MIKVAFIGAPDSGKTTLAKMVSSKLNLKGYVPAYVHEFARDYITKYGVRPNTVAEQFYVLKKQLERETDMCSTSTQIMYTDCPLILPYIYAVDLVQLTSRDIDMFSELYADTLKLTKNRYDLIYYLRPFRETVIDDVRKQDLNRLTSLDTQIKAFLDLHHYNYVELCQDFETRISIVEKQVQETYILHIDKSKNC